MSWIQENKFTAALAGATAVGSIALISLAMGKGDDLDAAKTALKKALRHEAEVQSIQPYPNKKNLDEKVSIVDDYVKRAEELRNEFAAYRPSSKMIANFAPDKFSGIVSGYRSRLDEQFKAEGVILPEQCVYGFEAYSSKFPRPEATGRLNYQIKAMEWLMTSLAEQQPEALLNVVRRGLDFESSPVEEKRGAKSNASKPAYYAMPLDLTFRCDERQLNAFLASIANAEKYPFVIRAVRVQNERMTPPTSSDAKFQAPAPEPSADAFDFGAEFAIEGESSEEGAVVAPDAEPEVAVDLPEVANDNDDTRLLLPILGDEKINVFLKLDLILLNEVGNVTLEEMKEKANIQQSSSAS